MQRYSALPEGFSYISKQGLVEAKRGDPRISSTDPLIQANGTILRFENIEAQGLYPIKRKRRT